ncbi:peptidoglycan bridge formation glycyltransferase FemA/FemB family protein [Nocardioides sp. R-C-SC26]|uniref:lipid II:glycine glycyltransferase FemX n=1 Tax=Nocardioides sp. R-C-SC26 TaxID=2870414 RepID=UPI001E30BA03|nr:peptidoglycan bridge formation glycyltransferase FemA/FemB family protein [Nocardioides sp. R-C-SC26]
MSVRPIPEATHLAFIAAQPSASFLQTPAWAQVKSEWRAESLGWFDGEELVGAGLVLYRQLPKLRRFLAYLPEGPVIDWHADDLAAALTPLAVHAKKSGAFGVRMGPPVVTRRWDAAAIKGGLADPAVRKLDDVAPTARDAAGARVVSQLHELGWRPQGLDGGFAAGQPRHVFQIPLRVTEADGPGGAGGAVTRQRTEVEVLAGMNQLWRRNIKRADRDGVEVSQSSLASPDDLAAFHALYVHTAERDHFTPRGIGYFRTMLAALGAESPDRIRLWQARHEGDLVAATIAIRVGDHAWYSYGASSTEKREVRGSNAIQWAMIRDALAAGASVYDLRGITETLDADDPHAGLIQFKVGTGGEAVEYAGEWDLPLNRPLYRAFDLYMRRR